MNCQKCGLRPATAHIHSVVNGVVHDTYLCAECAEKYRNEEMTDNSFFKMLSSFFGDELLPSSEAVRCDCCGATFADISRTGRVGCGNCYKIFGSELEPILMRIHGRTNHIGKRPGLTEESVKPGKKVVEKSFDELEDLKKQLAEAIKTEQYEKAAELRDKIRGKEGKK